MPTDFTAYAHPVLAVACPDCQAGTGQWCKRPSGHKASDFHRARKETADRVFIDLHGEAASIERIGAGWKIDPQGHRKAGLKG